MVNQRQGCCCIDSQSEADGQRHSEQQPRDAVQCQRPLSSELGTKSKAKVDCFSVGTPYAPTGLIHRAYGLRLDGLLPSRSAAALDDMDPSELNFNILALGPAM